MNATKGKRVVVTGIGLCTALGNEVDHVWKNLLENKSGIIAVENYNRSLCGYGVNVVAPCAKPCLSYFQKKYKKHVEQFRLF